MNTEETKKKHTVLIAVLILLAVPLTAVIICAFYYFQGMRYDAAYGTFININSTYVSYGTVDLNISEGRIKKTYPIDMTYTYQKTDGNMSPFYSIYEMEMFESADRQELVDAVSDFLSGIKRKDPRRALITAGCELVSAYNGNLVDKGALEARVTEDFPAVTDINVQEYYIKNRDPVSERVYELYDKLCGPTIQYSNGMTISLKDVGLDYNPVTGSISVDDDMILEAVREVTMAYDDVGETEVDFTGAKSGRIRVSGGTWGTMSDTAAEIKYVREKFHNIDNEAMESDRIPILRQEMEWDLPDTYIEVDKGMQHVFVYENGRLKMDADCVTGLPPRRSTPSGIFFISEKCKNRVLRGQGYASFVNRWMRITNSGIGLHDATWRGKFGGEIYKHNGSHGCINLPKAFAYDLYDYVLDKNRMCVIVHD